MTRSRPDACPGALQLHEAADGLLARIRLPGGQLAPAQLQLLADAATDLGNGELELTARGNVQLRAVSDPDELTRRLAEGGLLPSATHERVRNIVASPLSGRLGGAVDVREHVRELDRRILAEPELAALPGRVLFSIDDGTGDISGLGADIGLHASTPEEFGLILAGVDTGVRVPVDQGVDTAVAAAHAFRSIRDDHWRLHEIPDAVEKVLDALGLETTAEVQPFEATAAPPIGWLDQDNGLVSLGAGVKFGTVPARVAEFLAAIERPITVTPWRSLVISDLDEAQAETVVRVMAPMGLIFDAESPWLTVSACTGRPGCAKALADVRADAVNAVEYGELPVLGRQHWAGCERKCGRPQGAVTDIVATGTGYRIDEPSAESGDILEP